MSLTVFLSRSSHGKLQRRREMSAVSKAKTWRQVNCWFWSSWSWTHTAQTLFTWLQGCFVGYTDHYWMAFWKQIPEQNIGHFLSGCNFPYCNNGFFPSFQTHFSSLTLSLLSALTLLRRRNCFSGNCTLMMQFSEQKLFESLQIIFLLLNFYLHLRMSSVRFCFLRQKQR